MTQKEGMVADLNAREWSAMPAHPIRVDQSYLCYLRSILTLMTLKEGMVADMTGGRSNSILMLTLCVDQPYPRYLRSMYFPRPSRPV